MARLELLTSAEAAAMLRVSKVTLLRRIRRGEIPHRKLSARQLVFVRSELETLINGRAPGRRLEDLGR